MTQNPPVSDRIVSVSRTIPAPRERVYDALTSAETARKWWVMGPYSFSELVIEARPGGRFVYAIVDSRDGSEYRTYGEYLEAVRPSRLAFSNAEGGGTYVSIALEDAGNGSTLIRVFHGVYRDAAERDMHQEGWSACLENLAAVVSNPK